MTIKLLFVCLGNICRSPAAEGIMNHLIQANGLEAYITCDSAGTSGYHLGEPPDDRMTRAARSQGIPLGGQSRRVEPMDLETFDVILAMDRANYRALQALDPTGQYRDKIRLMCDFCQQHSATEVPDPYYGGEKGFEAVIELLLDACQGLLQDITQNRLPPQWHSTHP